MHTNDLSDTDVPIQYIISTIFMHFDECIHCMHALCSLDILLTYEWGFIHLWAWMARASTSHLSAWSWETVIFIRLLETQMNAMETVRLIFVSAESKHLPGQKAKVAGALIYCKRVACVLQITFFCPLNSSLPEFSREVWSFLHVYHSPQPNSPLAMILFSFLIVGFGDIIDCPWLLNANIK